MQLDDLNNQQDGLYQSLPEPISSVQTVYSPPAQAEPQLHQGPYQQTAGQLHPRAYLQHGVQQLHQGPYQAQTVSENTFYQSLTQSKENTFTLALFLCKFQVL